MQSVCGKADITMHEQQTSNAKMQFALGDRKMGKEAWAWPEHHQLHFQESRFRCLSLSVSFLTDDPPGAIKLHCGRSSRRQSSGMMEAGGNGGGGDGGMVPLVGMSWDGNVTCTTPPLGSM